MILKVLDMWTHYNSPHSDKYLAKLKAQISASLQAITHLIWWAFPPLRPVFFNVSGIFFTPQIIRSGQRCLLFFQFPQYF